MALPKLALGTAQFGLDYGIAGLPKVSRDQVRKILSLAALNDIRVLDTAHQYGNALDVLGSFSDLIKKKRFRIVLKAPEIPDEINLWKMQDIRSNIFADIARLKLESVDTIMIHNPACLLRPGSDLVYDMIVNMKYLGFCKNIGVSVYDVREVKAILGQYGFDVVSFPSNIVDHRFVDKAVEYMSALRVEMHARSVFLQGLLLLPHNEFMKSLSWEFKRITRHISAKFEGDMLKACLSYLRQSFPINHGVIGVHSVEQLQEIITTYNSIDSWYHFDSYEIKDLRIIDPRRW
jgi:aryl-alcohol dehydrogenase-like predicted oxidoreductase